MNICRVNLRVMKDFLAGLEGTSEEILAKLLKSGTEGCVEANTLEETTKGMRLEDSSWTK